MFRFWCYFEWENEKHVASSNYKMEDFTEGFWLSKELKFTYESNKKARYWIPPHRIFYIEKTLE